MAMDFITNLPTTKNGNDSNLTIVDRFTKYVVLVQCKISVNAADVAKHFLIMWYVSLASLKK